MAAQTFKIDNGATIKGGAEIFGPVNLADDATLKGSLEVFGDITLHGNMYGAVGYTGSRGNLGYTGSIGYTGSAGEYGAIGFTGSRGANGFTGSLGPTGFTGSASTAPGYTGSLGPIGYTGSTGAGFTGSRGYVGSQGDIGYTGSAGTNGFTGSTGAGYTGSRGYVGSQGDSGYTGSIGFTGSASTIIGYTGSAGTQGGIGYTGSKGDQGNLGYTGSIGFTGSKGDQGNIGYTGSGASGSPQFTALGVGISAGTSGTIRATGNITAYQSSDKNLKENIKPITGALEKIRQITGVNFDWTDEYIALEGGEDGYFVRKQDVGVIAQEIQGILPEVVAERPDGYLAVKYDRIIPLLIQAIKELEGRIDGDSK